MGGEILTCKRTQIENLNLIPQFGIYWLKKSVFLGEKYGFKIGKKTQMPLTAGQVADTGGVPCSVLHSAT